MTQPDHLADDVFSALVDGQLSPDEFSSAHAHLGTCSVCQARLAEMQALVGLLRALPAVEPPRDFQIGPRLVADPPNVIRLRRWYAVTRVGAGALAAAFVFLSVGTLYVDSRPTANTSATLASKAQPSAPEMAPAPPNVSAPAPANASAPAPQNPAAPAARNAAGAAASDAARPAAVPAASPAAPAPGAAAAPVAAPPAAAGAGAAAPAPTSTEPGDQIAAATTVRPLPTPVPTPTPVAKPSAAFATSPVPQQQTDPAAPLRVGAALVGVLAAFGILLALFIRHRLRALSPSQLE